VSLTDFFLEPRDEVVGVCRGHIARALVHRGVTTPTQCSKFGFEFVVVEYTWIKHDLHCGPPSGAPAGICCNHAMNVVHSFAPILGRGANTLILGSMPGVASLAAQQYYAHPRNAFWPIMGTLFGAGPELPYDARTERLRSQGVAIWDVLKLCTREGSLDSAIVESSIETNDFEQLFAENPGIDRVFFNGAKAAETYRRYVKSATPQVEFTRLPSTSPAHAALDLQAKTRIWADALSRGPVSGSAG
jgi:hypoxanthine-DNA glycosylase